MGICTSCEAASVATAKLVLQDGRLEEFSYPVKVSYLVSKDPNVFICHSDEMDFDGVVSAISDNEELELGQLYFALPLSKLNRPLQAEELAALAVKANAALLKSQAGEKCHRKKTGFFGGEKEEKCSAKVADVGSAAGRKMKDVGNQSRSQSQSRNGNGRGKVFVANLNAIPE